MAETIGSACRWKYGDVSDACCYEGKCSTFTKSLALLGPHGFNATCVKENTVNEQNVGGFNIHHIYSSNSMGPDRAWG